MGSWEVGEEGAGGLVDPGGHVWVGAKAEVVCGVGEALEDFLVGTEACDAEGDDDDADAGVVVGLDKVFDACFGLGSSAWPIFAEGFALDVCELA